MWLFIVAACLIPQGINSEGYFRKRHLNPQEFMTISEIIQYWNYPSEKYEVETEDGYYLEVDRIPFGKHSPGNTGPRPVALILHGLQLECRCWIANLPNNSLGFALADAGYDVWLLNNRGTTWSRRNKYLSIDEDAFWDFSFHEMGVYDLPATIDFILQKTKQDSLYIIGQSQGPSIALVALSVIPELARKVKLLMCFAPVYTLVGNKSPPLIFLRLPDEFKTLLYGKKEFCLFSNKIKALHAKICSYPVIDRICLQLIFATVGWNQKNLNVSRVDVYIGTFPDYTSTKTIVHWSQIYRSKEFKYFDYGSKNKAVYNMTTPPFYKIENMHVPTAVWTGGNDFMVSQQDIERLLPRLPQLVFYKNIPGWQHSDFMWGLDAPERLFPDVLYLMQKYR